jgi:hypothetical protein
LAKDPSNETEVADTKKFLDNIATGENKMVFEIGPIGVRVDGWVVPLDGPGFEAVKNHKGIKSIEKETRLRKYGVLPRIGEGPAKPPQQLHQ